jgi:2-iminoacetate synthase
MSFYNLLGRWGSERISALIASADERAVRSALTHETLSDEDFLALLSPAAEPFLESMAQRAKESTLRHFGRTIQLFTPLYLSNFCVNGCVYCGFSAKNPIQRMKLSVRESEQEARTIAGTGLRHILLLTGESEKESPVAYIAECAEAIRKFFDSVSVEVYPLTEEGYGLLSDSGVDGITLFQETYDEALYEKLHPFGPKRDYRNRLDAPERACRASMRTIGIGALLGLGRWRSEAFLTGLHGSYLQRKYPSSAIGFSLPRIRPHTGSFMPTDPVGDRELLQIMLATRLYLPGAHITISTREQPAMRDNMAGLGMTRMSAGVSTGVGGRASAEQSCGQFDISDSRSVDEVCAMLESRGYQPVFKDWMQL